MLDTIKRMFLARFIPQRTLIGLTVILLSLSGALTAILGSDLCMAADATAAVCGVAKKVLPLVGQFLFIIGVADQKRS
jgi:predicted tellurium resistance membrane protein TerC